MVNFYPGNSLLDEYRKSLEQCLAERERKAVRLACESAKKKSEEDDEDGDYYQGKGGTSAIDIIEEFELGFCVGNVIKYLIRAGRKKDNSELSDLKKALWYLERHIESLE
jgi:hypothetical protein